MGIVHERIREQRIKKDIYQPELAKMLNVSKQTVSNWESGKRTPDVDTLLELSKIFDVSCDYLMGKSDSPRLPSDVIPEKELADAIKKRLEEKNLWQDLDSNDYDKYAKQFASFLKAVKGFDD